MRVQYDLVKILSVIYVVSFAFCFSAQLEAQELANALPASSSIPETSLDSPCCDEEDSDNTAVVDYRGWDYLAEKLIRAGHPKEQVVSVFSDARMPLRTPVPFKLKPRETQQMYSAFTSDARIKIATQCLSTHEPHFIAAEKSYSVSRYVLAALLLVETQCGQMLGSQLVLDRLARVSSVGEPKNLEFNLQEQRKIDPLVQSEDTRARAEYLEGIFFPELEALFALAYSQHLDLFSLKGSSAGAFGIPQFLPSSLVRFGVDGDGNGVTDLFDPKDAIPSAANFLHSFGWNDHGSIVEKKRALWHYNRSDAYGEAVLKVSILMRQRMAD